MAEKRLPMLQEHDIQAERLALGVSLTRQPFTLDYFTREDSIFYDLRHQKIGRAIGIVAQLENFVDAALVTKQLRAAGDLEAAGNLDYVYGLTADVPFVPTADIYLESVLELAQRRANARLNLRIAEALKNGDYPEASRLAAEGSGPHKPEADRRYRLHTAAEAFEPQPPIPWVIDRMWAEATVNAFVGDAGVGKTRALTDAACCVAAGRQWLGFNVVAGPVLIVQEESGRDQSNRRTRESLIGHGLGPDVPLYSTILENFQLSKPPEQDALEAAITETGAVLVIVDALADIMPGLDENLVKDTQPIMMALRRIADRTRAAIVLIHHLGKNGTSRGSSAIRGAVDTLLVVKGKDGNLQFEFDKCRDTEPFKFSARMQFADGSFRLEVAETVESSARSFSKSQNYVLRYLREHGPSLMPDIESHADECSANAARQAVYSLVSRREVQRVDGGGAGRVARYGLVSAENDLRQVDL